MASLKPRHSAICLVARVLEHVLAVADQHRDVRHADVEAVEQLLHAGVAVEIDHRVGVPVAREEFLDAQRAGAVSGSDEHGIAEPARHQRDAPQDKGAHDDFAQVGVGLDQRQQLLAIHLDHFARFHGASAHQRGRPESMFTSPVNCPGPCTTIGVSPPIAVG